MRPAIIAGAMLLCACNEEHHEPHAPSRAEPSGNVVQKEMQLLTSALEAAVRGIGTGDVRNVEHKLHRVHQARTATGAALASGEYRPPKNAENMGGFRTMDEAFHEELEGLAQASARNDVPAVARKLGVVLQSCNGCHAEFR